MESETYNIEDHSPYFIFNVSMSRKLESGPILLIPLYVLTFILAIAGNVAVVIVCTKSHNLSSDLKVYLMSLAAADICMAVFCMPFEVTPLVLYYWPFGDVMCPIVKYSQQVSITVSIYTLVAVSIDRYRAVINPLQQRVSVTHKGVIVAIVWILALTACAGQLVFYRIATYYKNTVKIVQCDHTLGWRYRVLGHLIGFSAKFLIPFFILIITYGGITYKLWVHRTPGQHNRERSRMRTKKKVFLVLLVAVLAFFLCWLPLQVFFILELLYPPINDPSNLHLVKPFYFASMWLAMAHSFVNPIIYTFMNDKFRNDLRNICCSWRRPEAGMLIRLSTGMRRRLSSVTVLFTRSTSQTSVSLRKTECNGNQKEESRI